jgi:hypothetical protein
MVYAVGGLIEASDYNGFISTNATNLNDLWNVGSVDKGYGQTALTTVNVNDIVYATLGLSGEWNKLFQTIIDISDHQGTVLGAWINSNPVTGDIIYYEPQLSNNLTLIETNRLNAAAQSGTTSTTITNNTTWNDSLTFTWTITFANHDSARYFFNAGGQLSIDCVHPPGMIFDIDQLVSDICSDAGTIWLSSTSGAAVTLSGITYNGVTKVGGANPGGLTINQNNGFYALGPALATLIQQTGDLAYNYYNNSFLRISASYDGAGTITIEALIDEVNTVAPAYGGAVVSIGTTSTLTVRPPSTTYLTNTWGAPTITSTITPVTQP